MSDSIITRIDEMGERIDDLERSVQDLVSQAEEGDGEDKGAVSKHDDDDDDERTKTRLSRSM